MEKSSPVATVRRISATCTARTSVSAPGVRPASPACAVHNLDFSRTRRHGEEPMTEAQRNARPPVDHPVVRTHPETGRKCLFLGDHAEYIVGMDYAEGRALIEELNRLAVHPDLTYPHRWSSGQLLVWDNRCLLHRATYYDPAIERRVIRRCTVLGEEPR
jgi:alpha-ketoglutarate-dependent taurine dioxygenase